MTAWGQKVIGHPHNEWFGVITPEAKKSQMHIGAYHCALAISPWRDLNGKKLYLILDAVTLVKINAAVGPDGAFSVLDATYVFV